MKPLYISRPSGVASQRWTYLYIKTCASNGRYTGDTIGNVYVDGIGFEALMCMSLIQDYVRDLGPMLAEL